MSTFAHRARSREDACPGAVQLHQAVDGGLARIRIPGGLLTVHQLRAVAAAAADLGSGFLDLTSRANVQIRGLAPEAGAELAARLEEHGLLPSSAHERVRNVIASPLSGCDDAGFLDVHPLVAELDRRLCAAPEFAQLSGRFLFVVDDGRADVVGLQGDIAVLPVDAGTVALLLAGVDSGLRLPADAAVDAMIAGAQAFMAERAEQESGAWRVGELDQGVPKITARLRVEFEDVDGAHGPLTPDLLSPRQRGPVGIAGRRDGRATLAAAAPLGRLSGEQVHAIAETAADGQGEVRLTPWRSVVIPVADDAAPQLSRLDTAGLVVDSASPWIGVTACAGCQGCAKSWTDVRADATRALPRLPAGISVHWAGCSRRCGRPRGQVVDVVADEDGYEVRDGDEVRAQDAEFDTTTAAVAAVRRQE